MNALDVALVLILTTVVAGGVRVGFVARALTWLGVVAGLLGASWTVPLVLRMLDTEPAGLRFIVGIGVMALTVTLCTAVFQTVGASLLAGLGTSPLSRLDRVLGGIAGFGLVLGLTWFLLPVATQASGVVAEQARASTTLALVERFAPAPPDATANLRALIDQSRLPEVWGDLRPPVQTSPPPAEVPVDADVVARATASTVHVGSFGCGRRYDGSGVTVAPGLVVTNAHVVAGADEVQVEDPDGRRYTAAVVRFDPERDLALLAVDDLTQAPLPLAEIAPRSDGVSIGYPGGQSEPRVAPLRVEERRLASGKDIYGETATQREVLFLSADLRQGDSGSPVIDEQGRVGGIVFAISPDQQSTAYALDLVEVDALLAAPRVANDTGRCVE